jgi:hypothetical protein
VLDIFSRLEPGLKIQQRVLDMLEAEGLPWRPNAKINMGLGRAGE